MQPSACLLRLRVQPVPLLRSRLLKKPPMLKEPVRLATLACLFLVLPALAQAPKAKTKPLALRAAHLFDARKGTLVSPGLVVVVGDSIAQVSGEPPAGAEVIDLGDATLLPGLMDAHDHLSSEGSRDFYQDAMEGLLVSPAEQVQRASVYARRTLEAGFTAVRDLGSNDFISLALRNAINAGVIVGPRLLISNGQVGSVGGHADQDPFPTSRIKPYGVQQGLCNGADECRAAVRWQLKYGADVIKFMASGGVLSLGDPPDVPQLSQAEMDAIVEEAHAWKRRAAAHCHGDRAARMAIQAGVDSIEHGSFLQDDTLALMKKRGTFFVPTTMTELHINDPLAHFPPPIAEKGRLAVAAHDHALRSAIRLGVRIALGTDSGVTPHGLNAKELGLLVHSGMTPSAALQAATVTDAELFGLEGKLGALEKGKLADVIAVPGNVLADVTATERVLFVMKGGQVVKRPGPAPAPQKPRLLLRAAHLFDARSDSLLEHGAVLIEGDKIIAVGAALEAPADAQVVDLGDATLLPGLIDAHVHLSGEAHENFAQDFYESALRFPAEDALLAQQFGQRTLQAGFTTVRNLGSADQIDSGLRNAIDQGIVEGPRILAAGYPLTARGGHGDGTPLPLGRQGSPRGVETGVCAGADQCRDAVRWQLKYGADVIKFMASGGVLSLADAVDTPQFTADEMYAIVDEAHRWGRKVAAHCHGDSAARIAIAAGVDSIEHGSFLKPGTLAEMKRKGTFLVPTLSAGETVGRKGREGRFPPSIAPKAIAASAAIASTFATAVQLGVRIALGTDSGVSPHGENARELILMAKAGLSPAAALRAATSEGAQLLGLADRLGTLEPGKLADVIAVPGNALLDLPALQRPLLVVKGGRVVRSPPATAK